MGIPKLYGKALRENGEKLHDIWQLKKSSDTRVTKKVRGLPREKGVRSSISPGHPP